MIGSFAPPTEFSHIEQQHVNGVTAGVNAPSDIPDHPSAASAGSEWPVVNDEEIDIGVAVRGTLRLGAEQDNQQWIQLLQHGASEGVHETGIQVADSRRQRLR